MFCEKETSSLTKIALLIIYNMFNLNYDLIKLQSTVA